MSEFDFSQQIINTALIRRAAQADANDRAKASTIQEWEDAYNRRGRLLRSWQAAHADLEAEVAALRAQLEQQKLEKAFAEAKALGASAYLKAMQAAAPNCAAMADTGLRFADGDVKTVGRIAYEQAFDAHLISIGIKNPAQYRLN